MISIIHIFSSRYLGFYALFWRISLVYELIWVNLHFAGKTAELSVNDAKKVEKVQKAKIPRQNRFRAAKPKVAPRESFYLVDLGSMNFAPRVYMVATQESFWMLMKESLNQVSHRENLGGAAKYGRIYFWWGSHAILFQS